MFSSIGMSVACVWIVNGFAFWSLSHTHTPAHTNTSHNLSNNFPPHRQTEECSCFRLREWFGDECIYTIFTPTFFRLRMRFDVVIVCSRQTIVFPILISDCCWLFALSFFRQRFLNLNLFLDAFASLYWLQSSFSKSKPKKWKEKDNYNTNNHNRNNIKYKMCTRKYSIIILLPIKKCHNCFYIYYLSLSLFFPISVVFSSPMRLSFRFSLFIICTFSFPLLSSSLTNLFY